MSDETHRNLCNCPNCQTDNCPAGNSVDAAMLGRQCDLARAAETQAMRYSNLLTRLYRCLQNGGYGSNEYAEIMEEVEAAQAQQGGGK